MKILSSTSFSFHVLRTYTLILLCFPPVYSKLLVIIHYKVCIAYLITLISVVNQNCVGNCDNTTKSQSSIHNEFNFLLFNSFINLISFVPVNQHPVLHTVFNNLHNQSNKS